MYLKHIKLSGFKSFVDPTTIAVPARVVGVVGPNGCGKSNVIDAVRWVMGESSAKTLRGDSMADVIFNGSSARKPVGKAMVELVFDNAEGKAPGPYGQYNEIAIRRELSRDGQSNYLINKTRCRRRDITDIFLGTGMGPRSYSIIEQGMVSRIIEAKPEDLRALMEEAAGVSKYKDRRRETETRIRHTKENLDRVADIQSELETQLRRLKRQSGAAERYKKLKAEERLVRAQLLSLRWLGLAQEAERQDRHLALQENGLEAKVAEQRGVEREIEQLRRTQGETNEQFNKVQAEFYGIGGDIAGVEQQIEHVRQTRLQQEQELTRVVEAHKETLQHLATDHRRLRDVESERETSTPKLEAAKHELDEALRRQADAEQEFNAWQSRWEGFNSEAVRPEQEKQVQRTRIEEHETQIENLRQRERRLQDALRGLGEQTDGENLDQLRTEASTHDALCEKIARAVDDLDKHIAQKRSVIDGLDEQERSAREAYHALSARLGSLRELQAAAMGEHDAALTEWLAASGLDQARRLADELTVEAGWELALDRVMGPKAGALCVDELGSVVLTDAVDADLYLVERSAPAAAPVRRPCLADKVNCGTVNLSGWLAGVYVAEDLQSAMAMRGSLAEHESIVTRAGAWVGRYWIALPNRTDSSAGILVRDKEIAQLEQELGQAAEFLQQLSGRLEQEQRALFELEEEHGDRRRSLSGETRRRAEIHNSLGRMEARATESAARRDRLRADLHELEGQIRLEIETVTDAKSRLQGAELATRDFAQQRDELTSRRDHLRAQLQLTSGAAVETRENLHRLQTRYHQLQTEWSALTENVRRLNGQTEGFSERQQQLQLIIGKDDKPDLALKTRLDALLAQRVEVEQRLAAARSGVEMLDGAIREAERKRVVHEQSVQEIRAEMEQTRVGRQEIIVRRDTLAEQVADAEYAPADLLQEMPEDADETGWQESLDKIINRIDRIGPVNLVAIEEYEEQAERKTYLDKQHADLSEALATLESVIAKIDRETKTRFKETFDSLNARFQEFFPRLFGGGSAYLELTDTDLLDAGVAVMARPPGKRNSTIHLLSGGEKALTAVALLFSFFDLNPAPFCMLDEVDAPLDDANVERYTDILKTLSDRTQLIFITHNKITMECANILIGVTMMEPGVSRLVSVDVEEAIEMAAQ